MGEHKQKKKKVRYKSKNSKTSFVGILVLAIVAAVIWMDYSKRQESLPFKKYDVNRVKGNPEAVLQIVEFADFQCHQCKEGAKIISKYIKEYPDGIFLQLRYYPLGGLNSMISAKYAQCASEQNKFWEFHDELFDNQSKWRNLLKVRKELDVYAKDV
jgi:protein-disulfide isomerase